MSHERIDLVGENLLSPLPAAFLGGESLDLLEPLEFVGGPPLPAISPATLDRSRLAAALGVANVGYGHPSADRLARKLADPETLVVVTGQQPGLLGGPLYTLSKAVAAARWAERLEADGRPAVAVFWVATEDHDYLEVSRATFLTTEGVRDFDLGEDPSPLTPVGMRTLGPGMAVVLDELGSANPGDRWAEWIERLALWYRPEARFGEAFSRLIVGLLGERCPLMLDSMLPELKEAQRPWLRRLVEERRDIDEAFAAREAQITGRGFDLQVKPVPGASPLFFLRGQERRRVEWRDDGRIGLRGEEGFEEPIDWLLGAIDDNPGVVSPGVMARTTLQDATLGTALLVLGPGEVSYMAQVAPLYSHLGIRPPCVSLRPQALVLPSHLIDKLAGLEVGLSDLLQPEIDLDRLVSGGREEDLVGPVRDEIRIQLDRLREAAIEVDANLTGPWQKTDGQIVRALDAFTSRLAAAVARKSDDSRRRLSDLREFCRPHGSLQERVLSTAHFPGKYGGELVDALFTQLELESSALQVIKL